MFEDIAFCKIGDVSDLIEAGGIQIILPLNNLVWIFFGRFRTEKFTQTCVELVDLRERSQSNEKTDSLRLSLTFLFPALLQSQSHTKVPMELGS